MITYAIALGFVLLICVLAWFVKFTEDDDIDRPPRR